MMRRTIVALAMLAAGAVSSAQPATTQLDAVSANPKLDSTTQTEDVRFKNERDDRMTVAVHVSGAGPFRFLVDTGADRTAISRELAGRLGLVRTDAATVNTISGASMVSTADVPQLQLTKKPVKVRHAPMLERVNMGADGILGIDSLGSQRVQFDFEKQTLSIVPSSVSDFRDEPGTIVVKAARRNGRLVLTEASANGHALTVVIDTGAEISIGNEALRRQLVGRGLVDGLEKVALIHNGEPSIIIVLAHRPEDYLGVVAQLHRPPPGSVRRGDVRDLEIGGVTLNNLAIVFADAHSFKTLKLDRRPALLLGMNAIRAFKKVSIDFAKQKFRVVLPESSQLDVRLADARL